MRRPKLRVIEGGAATAPLRTHTITLSLSMTNEEWDASQLVEGETFVEGAADICRIYARMLLHREGVAAQARGNLRLVI